MQFLHAFSAFTRLAVLIVCFVAAQQEAAAQGKLLFDSTVLHLGTDLRSGDTLFAIFHFKNTGSQPVSIQKVSVPCNCTVPLWTMGPIAAGQRGQVTVKYYTGEDTGSFQKQLQVFSDAATQTIPLTIKGTVGYSTEQAYPCKTGAIRARCAPIDFGELLQRNNKEVEIQLFNSSTQALKLTSSNCSVPFIHAFLPDHEVPPGEVFTVYLRASPDTQQLVGLHQGTITIPIPGQEPLVIPVSVRVMEQFGPVVKQANGRPTIRVPKAMFEAGDVVAGKRVNTRFEIQNTGAGPLKIASYDAGGSRDAEISFSKKVARPGETLKMSVAFNTEGKSGQWTEMIYVHTSNPEIPLLRFSLQMNIIRP